MTFDHILHDPNSLSLLCGAGVFAVVVLIWTALVEGDPLTDRLKSISEHRDELSDDEKKKKKPSRRESLIGKSAIKELVQKLKLEQGKQSNEIRLKLARAGFRSRESVLVYLLMRVVCPIAVGFMAFSVLFVAHAFHLVVVTRILAFVICILLGITLPDLFLKNLSQKRGAILRKAMPDALDLLVICAEAGLSLNSSLDRVSREMAPSCAELSEEIGLTGVELGFLPNRSQALQNFADRVPIQGVLGLVNTLI